MAGLPAEASAKAGIVYLPIRQVHGYYATLPR